MANKDVELVIRARNFASKAVESLADSLGLLKRAQEDAGKSAGRMDGTLQKLAVEFIRLNTAVSKLSAASKIAAEMDKAEAAVSRLEQSTHKSTQQFAASAREQERATSAANRLRSEVEALAKAHEQQREAAKAATKAERAADAELARAEKRQSRVLRDASRQTQNGGAVRGALASALVFADADVAAAKRAIGETQAASKALNAELEDTKRQQADVGAALKAASRLQEDLASATRRSADAVRADSLALKEARSELQAVRSAGVEASAALGGIPITQERIASETKRATEELKREEAVLQSMARYSTGSIAGGFADPRTAKAIRGVREEMELARQRQKTLEDQTRSLARVMSAGGATDEQAQQFRIFTSAARAAKAESEAFQTQLAKLQGSGSGTFAALNQIDGGLAKVARQARLTAEQLREMEQQQAVLQSMARYSTGSIAGGFADPTTAARVRKVVAALDEARERQRGLVEETQRMSQAIAVSGGQSQEQITRLKEVSAAARQASEEVRTYRDQVAAAMSGVPVGTRDKTALESLRAEVEQARQSYVKLRTEAQQLAQSLRATDAPTEQQQATLRSTVATARQAFNEFGALQQQLDRLNAAWGTSFQALNKFDGGLKTVAVHANSAGGAMRELQERTKRVFENASSGGPRALSLYQRLRSEVLALTIAYVGLFNAIDSVAGVLKTYQATEAAENRLGAVHQQNPANVRSDMMWADRQATRLGIGNIADFTSAYAKFAATAKNAGFEAQNIRKVFLSISEANRVNKLTTEEMNGVFLAFTQMINKGKISAEELNQWGERFPAVYNIVADALGVTTEKLNDMMKAGEVFSTQGTFLKIAEQLDKRFGSQLQQSLSTTTTLIGRFWAEISHSQAAVAAGGFIKGFNTLLTDTINLLSSDAGHEFFLGIGAALGRLMEVLAVFVRNFNLVLTVMETLLVLRVATWASSAASAFITWSAANTATAASLATVNTTASATTLTLGALATTVRTTLITSFVALRSAALSTFASLRTAAVTTFASVGAAAGAASGAMRVLAASLATARAAIGGLLTLLARTPVGLAAFAAFYVIGEIFSSMATSVDPVTEALEKHERVMQKVAAAYEQARGNVQKWKDDFGKNNIAQLNADYKSLGSSMADIKQELIGVSWSKDVYNSWSTIGNSINRLRYELGQGKIEIRDFKAQLQTLFSQTDNANARTYISSILETVGKYEALAQAQREAGAAAKLAGSNLDGLSVSAKEAQVVIDGLTYGVKLSGDNFTIAAQAAANYASALGEIAKLVPELNKIEQVRGNLDSLKGHLETLKRSRALMSDKNGLGIDDAGTFAAIDQAINKAEIEVTFRGMDGAGPGLREASKSYAATVADAAGKTGIAAETISAATTALNNGMVDFGGRGFIDRLPEAVKQAVEQGIAEGMSPFEALAQYAKGKGVDEFSSAKDFLKAIGANPSFSSAGSAPDRAGSLEAAQHYWDLIVEYSKELVRQREKYAGRTSDTIQKQKDEIEQNSERLVGLTREAAIQKAISAEKAKNPNISARDLAIIGEQAAKLYDQKAQLEQINKEKKRGNGLSTEEKEQRRQIAEQNRIIGNLEQARNNLLREREYYEKTGNTEKLAKTETKLQDVNAKLQESIETAISFWKSIGGAEAEAAIAKLESLKGKIGEVTEKSKFSAAEFNEKIADGATSAFDGLFQKMKEGQSVLSALRDSFLDFASSFLIEIGKMILKQALLNALQNNLFAGNTVGGHISGAMNALFGTATGAAQTTGGAQTTGVMAVNASTVNVGGTQAQTLAEAASGVDEALLPANAQAVSLEGGTTLNSVLAADRQKFYSELSDPNTLQKLFSRLENEVGGQQSAQIPVLESILNSSSARGKTISQTVSSSLYDKRNEKSYSFDYLNDKYSDSLKQVMSGSNLSNYATGNASKSGIPSFDSNPFNGGYKTGTFEGEWTGVEGPDKPWAAEKQRQYEESLNAQSQSLERQTAATDASKQATESDTQVTQQSSAASQQDTATTQQNTQATQADTQATQQSASTTQADAAATQQSTVATQADTAATDASSSVTQSATGTLQGFDMGLQSATGSAQSFSGGLYTANNNASTSLFGLTSGAQGATGAMGGFEGGLGGLLSSLASGFSGLLSTLARLLMSVVGGGSGGLGGLGSIFTGLIGMVFHEGGVVGQTTASRAVAPSWFADAVRYHEGGISGLKPGEIPAVLREGEVVDPGDGSVFEQVFGKIAGKAQPAAAPNIKVVNAFDAGSFVSEGLATSVGEEAFMNFVRANSSRIKSVLG